jgi:hypothetical protein
MSRLHRGRRALRASLEDYARERGVVRGPIQEVEAVGAAGAGSLVAGSVVEGGEDR